MTPPDPTWFLPDWAPNLHPIVVHFPIGLLVTAFVVDVFAFVFRRQQFLNQGAAGLYTLGTLLACVAFLTGRNAAATVFTPGMAHALVDEHWTWGLWTTLYFCALTSLRLVAQRRLATEPRTLWGLMVLGGALGVLLLAGTAERGAGLVYQYGVGVIRPQS